MNFLKGVAEYFTPVLKESGFHEKGVLTPEEFVQAGDHLVDKCPSWRWAGGEASLRKPYLPEGKQFLITRNVHSMRRANSFALDAVEEEVEHGVGEFGADEEGWSMTTTTVGDAESAEIKEIGADVDSGATASAVRALLERRVSPEGGDGDFVPDIEDLEDKDLLEAEEADSATLQCPPEAGATGILGHSGGVLRAVEPEDHLVHTRSYDLSITYDKYYRTPRMWLFGYDERKQPLTPNQIMEDISSDHANKTVTVEDHPHISAAHLSIHPCKHAHVMKRIVDQLQEAYERHAEEKERSADQDDAAVLIRQRVNVNQYMFLFLKFMSAVLPTIEFDYTTGV